MFNGVAAWDRYSFATFFWYCVAYSHWKESKIIEEVHKPLQNLRTLRESENEEKKSNKTEMAMPRKPSD